MELKKFITNNSSAFLNLCRIYEVQKIYAFGSVIRDDFDEQTSDLDLLVELKTEDPIQRGINLMHFWDELESFFNRKVDLLTEASIRNPVLKKSIDSTKVLIYDEKGEQVVV